MILKVIAVGKDLAVILNEEARAALGVKEGDELILTPSPGGFRVTPADAKVKVQLETAREIMGRRKGALGDLAKN